jgi:hypothetical protein
MKPNMDKNQGAKGNLFLLGLGMCLTYQIHFSNSNNLKKMSLFSRIYQAC